MDEKHYKPEEVAEMYRVNPETVYRWLRLGRLKGKKLGGQIWRVTESALREFEQVK